MNHATQAHQTRLACWAKSSRGRMKYNIGASFPDHDNKVGT